jgi:UDP-glucose 4-epimerase
MKVVVSGANGFVGRALCAHLAAHGREVAAVVRSSTTSCALPGAVHRVSGLFATPEWTPALEKADAFVHLAARAHVLQDPSVDPLATYRRVNCQATLDLARLAARSGVRRFVFLSTIKVNGERTEARPFTEADVPAPTDPYAISKWEAEQGLVEIAGTTGLEVVSVRPPLVYGPHVTANFLRLMHIVSRRIPLPLSSITNLRSFIYLDNLVSALEALLSAELPRASTFLVSDDHDLSTPDLLREIGEAMGVGAVLLPCPPRLLLAAGWLLGRHDEARRMIESLRADCSRFRRTLRWRPPFSPTQGIAQTVAWFQAEGLPQRHGAV